MVVCVIVHHDRFADGHDGGSAPITVSDTLPPRLYSSAVTDFVESILSQQHHRSSMPRSGEYRTWNYMVNFVRRAAPINMKVQLLMQSANTEDGLAVTQQRWNNYTWKSMFVRLIVHLIAIKLCQLIARTCAKLRGTVWGRKTQVIDK